MGDNVVDRYINKEIMFPGGNAVNFAVYAKKCGIDSAYLGVFADDQDGRLIRNALIELGIEVSACPVFADGATERCDVVLNDGDRTFIGDSWTEGKEHRSLKLDKKMLEYLRGFDVIHCGCYAEMENEMAKVKDFECVRTFDFSSEEKYRTDEYLRKICPSIDIALFSEEKMNRDQISSLQKKVIALGTSCVLTTNGTKGQTLYDGEREYQGMVKLIRPVDTMGAGDAFFAAFVSELMRSGWKRNLPLSDEKIGNVFLYAAEFSSAAAALILQVARMPSPSSTRAWAPAKRWKNWVGGTPLSHELAD